MGEAAEESSEVSDRGIAVGGDQAAMHQYYWFSRYEDSNRLQARRAHPIAIDLWQRGIELRSRPFKPGTSIPYTAPTSTTYQILQHLSFEYRINQSILAIGTSKVALDATIEGYYSQALMLCRNLLESAKRMAYARRSPEDSFRWFPRELFSDNLIAVFGDRFISGEPERKDWRKVFPDLPEKGLGNLLDWQMMKGINLHINDLHAHAHPTYHGFTQQQGDVPRSFILNPDFNESRSLYTLREGSVAEHCLTHELASMVAVDDFWLSDIDRWRDDYMKFYDVNSVVSEAEAVEQMRRHEAK